jgi:hypothetical protein
MTGFAALYHVTSPPATVMMRQDERRNRLAVGGLISGQETGLHGRQRCVFDR